MRFSSRPMAIHNAQRSLEKAKSRMEEVITYVSEEHYEEIKEALSASIDLCENAIRKCEGIRKRGRG